MYGFIIAKNVIGEIQLKLFKGYFTPQKKTSCLVSSYVCHLHSIEYPMEKMKNVQMKKISISSTRAHLSSSIEFV